MLKTLLLKSTIALLFLVALGLPVLRLEETLIWAGFVVVLAISDLRQNFSLRFFVCGLGVAFVAGHFVRNDLQIQEGQGIFLPTTTLAAKKSSIFPPTLDSVAQNDFDLSFPARNYCDENKERCWRRTGFVSNNYEFSADGIWQTKTMSRRVEWPYYSYLRRFRIGRLNAVDLNFYPEISDVLRHQIPFFLKWDHSRDFPPREICWKDRLFVQDPEWRELRGDFSKDGFRCLRDASSLGTASLFYLHVRKDIEAGLFIQKNAWDLARDVLACVPLLRLIFVLWHACD
ncbi:MAG: hypothetical protein ABIR96_12885 [Bdellovibrionota bacterium]